MNLKKNIFLCISKSKEIYKATTTTILNTK